MFSTTSSALVRIGIDLKTRTRERQERLQFSIRIERARFMTLGERVSLFRPSTPLAQIELLVMQRRIAGHEHRPPENLFEFFEILVVPRL